ncbi:MAG: hypothetical protein PHE68_02855 [Candidatus Peribacteraceae bacterium]|nr:hypothetical protein [Candidatus Peribacteraceae bacterium]MDD5075218.1 hypothetical protein [Candidatus Peribacteraceae bacterium]
MKTNGQHSSAMPLERHAFLAIVKPNGVPHKEQMRAVSAQTREALRKTGVTAYFNDENTGESLFRGIFIECDIATSPEAVRRVMDTIMQSSQEISSVVPLYI